MILLIPHIFRHLGLSFLSAAVVSADVPRTFASQVCLWRSARTRAATPLHCGASRQLGPCAYADLDLRHRRHSGSANLDAWDSRWPATLGHSSDWRGLMHNLHGDRRPDPGSSHEPVSAVTSGARRYCHTQGLPPDDAWTRRQMRQERRAAPRYRASTVIVVATIPPSDALLPLTTTRIPGFSSLNLITASRKTSASLGTAITAVPSPNFR